MLAILYSGGCRRTEHPKVVSDLTITFSERGCSGDQPQRSCDWQKSNLSSVSTRCDWCSAHGRAPTTCRGKRLRVFVAASIVLLSQAIVILANPSFAARAEQTFLTNRIRFQTDKANVMAAWQFGRACFDWAEFAANDEVREEIAKQGITACRHVIALKPGLAAGHYYLAMNLGQLARTKGLGALKIVQEMEREFKAAVELDPKFEFAGPERSLGILYLEAPGWPTSVGSRSKARLHMEKAVELAPDYPENRLCLLEAYVKWNDKKAIVREAKVVEELLPRARKTLSGEEWQSDWDDWDKRWSAIQKTIKAKGLAPTHQ
jgi:hypothetical protein